MGYPNYPNNRLVVNGVDLSTEFKMVLVDGYTLEPPSPKTYVVDIPGGNGKIDLTESLIGDTVYDNRTQEFDFYIIDEENFETVKTNVSNFLHGKDFDYTMTMDPGYTYHGRFTVTEYNHARYQIGKVGHIHISIDAKPFKLWNDQIHTVYPIGGEVFKLDSGRMRVKPIFESNNNIVVIYNNKRVELPAGSHSINDVYFTAGRNEIYLKSKDAYSMTWGLLKTGKNIQGLTEYYLATSASSGVTVSTPGWTKTVPQTTEINKYLWNYIEFTYKKEGSMGDARTYNTTPCIINDLFSIVDIEEKFRTSNQNNTIFYPVSDNIPTIDDTHKNLWSWKRIRYLDGSSKSEKYLIDESGKNVSGISYYYLATPESSGITTSTAGWNNIPITTTSINKYLWCYERITHTDNSIIDTTPRIISIHGNTGSLGAIGMPDVTNYYGVSSSRSSIPTSWSETIPTLTNKNMYLWTYEKIVYDDDVRRDSTPRIIGTYRSVRSITKYYCDTVYYNKPSENDSWYTEPPNMYYRKGSEYKYNSNYLWEKTIIRWSDGSSSTIGPSKIYQRSSREKYSLKISVTNHYLATPESSGITNDTAGWVIGSSGDPFWISTNTTNKYLWSYQIVKAQQMHNGINTTILTYPPRILATDNYIVNIKEYYGVSLSNKSYPTSWSTTIPEMTSTKKYLWTYEEIEYTDGSKVSNAQRVIGTVNKFDSISGVTEYYAVSSSRSSIPTSWSTTIPTMTSTNKFLWNYKVITYTDDSTVETAKQVIGVYGNFTYGDFHNIPLFEIYKYNVGSDRYFNYRCAKWSDYNNVTFNDTLFEKYTGSQDQWYKLINNSSIPHWNIDGIRADDYPITIKYEWGDI